MADRRRSSDGDQHYQDATNNKGSTPADTKWSFNFRRLYAIVILTFVITIFALFYDQLSIAIKKVSDDDTGESCKVTGICGWRIAEYTYKDNGGYTGCLDDGTYSIDYGSYCDDNFDDDCLALDAGNVYLAFTIISLITLILLLIIFTRACLRKPIVNELIQKRIRIILMILFAITWVCEFIAAFVWLFMSLCDEADPNYSNIFQEDTANSFGVSTGCLLLCFIANLVGFGAVSFCWSDYSELSENPPAEQGL